MKKNLIRAAVVTAFAATSVLSLSGCVGSNAVTAKLMQFNVEVVDNRYGRAGVNLLLAPIYAITFAVDYVVVNSVEFWAGKNPVNGKPHIFDTKTKTMIEVNDELDPSLTEAPLDPITKVEHGKKEVYSAQVNAIDENTLSFDIVYSNGDKVTLRGEKEGEMISFYMDDELITTASMAELEAFANKA